MPALTEEAPVSVAAEVVSSGDHSQGGDTNESQIFGEMLAEASSPEDPPSSSGVQAELPAETATQAAGGAFEAALDQAADPNAGLDEGAPQAEEQTGVRALLAQAGYQLDGVPDDVIARSYIETVQQAQQATQRLAQIEQQLPQLQQFAQLGQQLYPHMQEFQAFLASKQQANSQPAPVPPQQRGMPQFKPAPEFDPKWMRLVDRDPTTGRYVGITADVPMDIVQKVNAHAEWRQDAADQMIQNIDQFTPEAIQAQAREAARQEFAQLQAQQQAQWEQQEQQRIQAEQTHYAQQAIQQLAPWVYEQHNGKTVIDPITGKPRVSQYGYAYANFVHQLQESGVTDPRAQDLFARQMLNAHIASQTQAAAAKPAAPAQPDKRAQFLQRNGAPVRRPQQNGSVLRAVASPAAPAQNTHLDFGAMLDQDLLQQTGQPARR